MPSRITWMTPDGDHISTVLKDDELPTDGTIHAKDWQGYDIKADVELVGGRYHCRAVHVFQRTDGAEVTGEAIRTLSLSRVIREGVRQQGLMRQEPLPTEDDRKLDWVARTYRRAYAVGDPPRQAIAQGLGVSSATAGRWIARARSAGLLGPAEGPGKAGG